MSQRPRAESRHSEVAPPARRRMISGERKLGDVATLAEQAQMRSGEYRATQLQDEQDEQDETEVSATELDLPPPSARMCDTVHIAGAKGEGIIHLVDGEVAWVATKGFDLPGFGRRLLDDGLVQRHELELVMALCRTEKLNVAEMLVQLELVDADTLRAAMIEHVGANVKALLSMREITGRWERTQRTFTGELTVPLDDVLTFAELERWAMVVAHSGGVLGERRNDGRVPLHVIASVDIGGGPHRHVLMMTENVSRTGALLRSPCELELGSLVRVRVTMGSEKLDLAARVVRIRTRDGEASTQHAVGVRWLDLSIDDHRALRSALDAIG